jgi:malate/lactate dehydrogenase
VILVVTNPPDPLADTARTSAGHDRVLSTGTFLDSLRFRVRLAEHFDVEANQVEAQVIGEHGVSQVFLWSAAPHAVKLRKERAYQHRSNLDLFAVRTLVACGRPLRREACSNAHSAGISESFLS